MSDSRPAPQPETTPTVLVVEDEALLRESIADYLAESGYQVVEAATAEEAEALFDRGARVDIVFSDVTMPGRKNGFQLAHWVRSHHPSVPVLLTSGYATAVRDASSESYEGPFLAKPYGPDQLIETIESVLHPR